MTFKAKQIIFFLFHWNISKIFTFLKPWFAFTGDLLFISFVVLQSASAMSANRVVYLFKTWHWMERPCLMSRADHRLGSVEMTGWKVQWKNWTEWKETLKSLRENYSLYNHTEDDCDTQSHSLPSVLPFFNLL